LSRLIWDESTEKIYETGLDRGVLYIPTGLPDWPGWVWNGLTSVVKKNNRTVDSVSFDGKKIHNFVVSGAYEATLTALTYPIQMTELEGSRKISEGVYLTDQQPKMFGLSYRSLIGDGVQGDALGYKINIVYNLIAIPADRSDETQSDEATAGEFEWSLIASPSDVLGFRPTAHIVIDSRFADQQLLEQIENIIYGNDLEQAYLPAMEDLLQILEQFFLITIVDHGDGSWSAIDESGEYVHPLSGGEFEILDTNAIYLDEETFRISSMASRSEITPEP